jgi:hypothetical protein
MQPGACPDSLTREPGSILDRLGRSLKDLIETLNLLKSRGIDFISLTEHIDTTTPGGKLIFHLMGALAEFERDLIRERTNAGLAAARARGRVGGRPRRASDRNTRSGWPHPQGNEGSHQSYEIWPHPGLLSEQGNG